MNTNNYTCRQTKLYILHMYVNLCIACIHLDTHRFLPLNLKGRCGSNSNQTLLLPSYSTKYVHYRTNRGRRALLYKVEEK